MISGDVVERSRRLAIKGQSLAQRLAQLVLSVNLEYDSQPSAPNKPGPAGPVSRADCLEFSIDLSSRFRLQLRAAGRGEWSRPVPASLEDQFQFVYDQLSTRVSSVDVQALEDLLGEVVDELGGFVRSRTADSAADYVFTGSEISYRLGRMGLAVTTAQLRTWASRGHIRAVREGTRNGYFLGDVVNYLAGR